MFLLHSNANGYGPFMAWLIIRYNWFDEYGKRLYRHVVSVTGKTTHSSVFICSRRVSLKQLFICFTICIFSTFIFSYFSPFHLHEISYFPHSSLFIDPQMNFFSLTFFSRHKCLLFCLYISYSLLVYFLSI